LLTMAIKHQTKALGIIMLAAFAVSCVSPGKLYKGFTKRKGTLDYIYDSEINHDRSTQVVHIAKPVIADSKFTRSGSVTKLHASVIPAIVYNQWKAQYEYRIGDDATKEGVTSFIQTALVTEGNRSGSFSADTLTAPRGLTLEIEIDSIGAQGPYTSQGHFLFLLFAYTWSSTEYGGTGTAYSRFQYRIRQGDKILVEDFVTSHKQAEPLRQTHKDEKALRAFYNAYLVEALSQTFKSNIEQIVKNTDLALDILKDEITKSDVP